MAVCPLTCCSFPITSRTALSKTCCPSAAVSRSGWSAPEPSMYFPTRFRTTSRTKFCNQ